MSRHGSRLESNNTYTYFVNVTNERPFPVQYQLTGSRSEQWLLSPLVVNAAEHPIQAVENAPSNFLEGVKDVAKDPKGTLTGAAEGAKDIAAHLGLSKFP
jgi:hypothetical protein